MATTIGLTFPKGKKTKPKEETKKPEKDKEESKSSE